LEGEGRGERDDNKTNKWERNIGERRNGNKATKWINEGRKKGDNDTEDAIFPKKLNLRMW
jgi:hypothetical protein